MSDYNLTLDTDLEDELLAEGVYDIVAAVIKYSYDPVEKNLLPLFQKITVPKSGSSISLAINKILKTNDFFEKGDYILFSYVVISEYDITSSIADVFTKKNNIKTHDVLEEVENEAPKTIHWF